MRSALNLLAAIGLAPGAVFDLTGTLASQPDLRSISCGIDSLGLIMAPTLLALKFLRSRAAVPGSPFCAGVSEWYLAYLATEPAGACR